jgi:hypothetical protein
MGAVRRADNRTGGMRIPAFRIPTGFPGASLGCMVAGFGCPRRGRGATVGAAVHLVVQTGRRSSHP